MKVIYIILIFILAGCSSGNKKDYSKPMIEQKDSYYYYKTQEQNMADIDSTYFYDEDGEVY